MKKIFLFKPGKGTWGGVTGNLVSPLDIYDITPDSNIINQNNIFVKQFISFEGNDFPNNFQIAQLVNQLPTFTVSEKEILIISVAPLNIPQVVGYIPEVKKFFLKGLGKGTYGIGGTQISTYDLELFYHQRMTLEDFEDLITTQIVDLGWTITGTNISDYVNNLTTPITFQSQEDGYVLIKVTNNSIEESYLFLGLGGTYGQGQLQTLIEDYQLIPGQASTGLQIGDNISLLNNDVGYITNQPVSATQSGIVNNVSLQELGGVDKRINGIRIGRGNGNLANNTVLGEFALSSSSGDYNVAIGKSSMQLNTTGFANEALGPYSLTFNTTGSYNTAIGGSSMYANLTGSQNVAIGGYSLYKAKNTQRVTAIGAGALYNYDHFASGAIAIGNYVGYNITGGNNTQIGGGGSTALNRGITTGASNIVLTTQSAQINVRTGSQNTYIGGSLPDAEVSDKNKQVIIADGSGGIALRKLADGTTTVPSQTNALITADITGKAVITKEYFDDNVPSQEIPNLYNVTQQGSVTTDWIHVSESLTDSNVRADLTPYGIEVVDNNLGKKSNFQKDYFDFIDITNQRKTTVKANDSLEALTNIILELPATSGTIALVSDIPSGGGGGDLQTTLDNGSTATLTTPLSIQSVNDENVKGLFEINNTGIVLTAQAGIINLNGTTAIDGGTLNINSGEVNFNTGARVKGTLFFGQDTGFSPIIQDSNDPTYPLTIIGGVTFTTPDIRIPGILTTNNTVTKGLAKGTSGELVEFDIPTGGGGGATNLTYTATATNGTVNSDTGTDAIIPLANSTDAGLLSPTEKTSIGTIGTKASLSTANTWESGNLFNNVTSFNNSVNITEFNSFSFVGGFSATYYSNLFRFNNANGNSVYSVDRLTNKTTYNSDVEFVTSPIVANATAPNHAAALGQVQTLLNLKANDADVLHKAGAETITGVKTLGPTGSLRFGQNGEISPENICIEQRTTNKYASLEVYPDSAGISAGLIGEDMSASLSMSAYGMSITTNNGGSSGNLQFQTSSVGENYSIFFPIKSGVVALDVDLDTKANISDLNNKVNKSGDTMTGNLGIPNATASNHAVALGQVQTEIAIVPDLTVALVVPNLYKYYALTGVGAVASLPPIAGNVGKTLIVNNKTDAAQSIFSNDSVANDIFSSAGAVNTFTFKGSVTLFNDGVHWVITN